MYIERLPRYGPQRERSIESEILDAGAIAMKEIQIERALRVSGVLLILGIVVEIISLLGKSRSLSCSSLASVAPSPF
jgi:hypothetical protein